MKKTACLLLSAAMLFSLSACGQGNPPPDAEPSPTAEAEVWSVPADLEPAFAAGIAEESMRQQAAENTVCTQRDAAVLLSNAYKSLFPEGNRFYEDMLRNASSEKPATRYWVAQGMYMANVMHWLDRDLYFQDLDRDHLSYEHEYTYTTYDDFVRHFSYTPEDFPQDAVVQTAFTVPDAMFKSPDPETGKMTVYESYWNVGTDLDAIFYHPDQEKYRQFEDYGTVWVVEFALRVTDRDTGKYAMTLDEKGRFDPQGELTFRDALEIAMVYSNFYEEDAVQVPVSEVGAYAADLITEDLLNRESSLPDCSCAYLPKEWKGTLYTKLAYFNNGTLGAYDNRNVLEAEIKDIADLGFNYIGLLVSPTYFQGPYYESNVMNEARLRELDRLLALCMKYDLHLDIRFSDTGNLKPWEFYMPDNWAYRDNAIRSYDAEVRQNFAEIWGAFARRYQGISNRDLSFNLQCEPCPGSDDAYIAFLKPAVDAIRDYTPDRCISVDLHDGLLQGQGYETLGVALSCHLYEPRDFCVYNMQNQEYPLPHQTWPYQSPDGRLIDSEAALGECSWMVLSYNDIQAIAKEHGLGFMVGEFGVFEDGSSRFNHSYYPYETIEAYMTDMAAQFEAQGVPWCYGPTMGAEALYASEPRLEECEYREISQAPYYVNLSMEHIFQKLLEP